jgi:phosphoglucomutase
MAFLRGIGPEEVAGHMLAGQTPTHVLTEAPAGGSLGGIKLVTDSGWVAARPSGTEPIYKIYAESYVSTDHLKQLLSATQDLIERGGSR